MTVTLTGGYQFRVALDHPGITTVNTFTTTTNDGAGLGGPTTIDAPPGDTFVIANLTFTNPTDRPEPLALVGLGSGGLPHFVAGVDLAVPLVNARAFGMDPSSFGSDCNTDNTGPNASISPLGFCSLSNDVVSFTPAQTDLTMPAQVPASSSGTLTLLGGEGEYGAMVSQSSPVQDIKVLVDTTAGSATPTWVLLS